jgi:hypothetical protein
LPRTSSNRAGLTFADVEQVGLTLPGVEAGTSWGTAALKLHGHMMACIPTNKQAEPDSFVICIDVEQRDELLEAEPDVYYVKPHYEDYPCVLVRLKKVHPDAIRDLLNMAWQFRNAKSARKRARPAARKRKRA